MDLTFIYDYTKAFLDFLIIIVMLYLVVRLIRGNAKTKQIFNGIAIVALLKVVSSWLDLTMVSWVLDYVMIWGVLAIMIIFQPEIRVGLEKMGAQPNFARKPKANINDYAAKELKNALIHLSETKTGALITIERDITLSDYVPSGTALDALISAELIGTIFYPNTPLHDGAVLIRNNRIFAAGVFYPSANRSVTKSQGARHRAAVAISEITDSITFVVSEETGKISVARSGKLSHLKEDDILDYIYKNVLNEMRTDVTKTKIK